MDARIWRRALRRCPRRRWPPTSVASPRRATPRATAMPKRSPKRASCTTTPRRGARCRRFWPGVRLDRTRRRHMEFMDKIAVVTGAASGIGRATAQQLAGAGADVIVADIDRRSGRGRRRRPSRNRSEGAVHAGRHDQRPFDRRIRRRGRARGRRRRHPGQRRRVGAYAAILGGHARAVGQADRTQLRRADAS